MNLRVFLDETLRSTAPTTVEDLAAAAVAAERTRSRAPATTVLNALRASPDAVALPDGRWTHALAVLGRTVLTHRVRYGTEGRTTIWPRADLEPFHRLLRAPTPLVGGGTVTVSARPQWQCGAPPPTWLGPPGWLPVVPAGALLAVTLTAAGLGVRPVAVDPEEVAERVDLLRATVAHHTPPRSAVPVSAYGEPALARFHAGLLGALLEVPDLLATPLIPLDEVFPDLAVSAEPALAELTGTCRCRCRPAEYEVWEPSDEEWDVGVVDDAVVRPLFDRPGRR